MSSDNGNGMMKHTSGAKASGGGDSVLRLRFASARRRRRLRICAERGLTLAEVRKQLEGKKGKRYWRSIDELAGTPEFEAAVAKEFPDAGGRSGSIRFRGAAF
jgi:hypothetical protein